MQAHKRPLERCLCILLLCIALAKPSAATPGEVPIGASLPDATLQGLNGPPRHFISFGGRLLLINVWATGAYSRKSTARDSGTAPMRYGSSTKLFTKDPARDENPYGNR